MANNYRYVLSVDPGGTNGMCVAGKKNKGDWEILQLEGVEKHILYNFIENFGFRHVNNDELLVIYETYRLYENKSKAMIGNEFETVQIIGVIKYICEKRGIKCIDSPTSNKAFFSDKRLKEMGLYVPIEHKRDAIRHFLYWLYFTVKEADYHDLLKSDVRPGQPDA